MILYIWKEKKSRAWFDYRVKFKPQWPPFKPTILHYYVALSLIHIFQLQKKRADDELGVQKGTLIPNVGKNDASTLI